MLVRMYWNNVTNEFANAPNFNINIPSFGKFYPIETIDPDPIFSKFTNVMGPLKEHYLSYGYKDGVDLVAAGTDWRGIPTKEWIEATRNVIEKAYASAGNKPLVVVGHSMGCPFVCCCYYFHTFT